MEPATGGTIADNIGLTAAVYRGFRDQVVQDYPNAAPADVDRWALGYYNMGREKAREWIDKRGGKGYSLKDYE